MDTSIAMDELRKLRLLTSNANQNHDGVYPAVQDRLGARGGGQRRGGGIATRPRGSDHLRGQRGRGEEPSSSSMSSANDQTVWRGGSSSRGRDSSVGQGSWRRCDSSRGRDSSVGHNSSRGQNSSRGHGRGGDNGVQAGNRRLTVEELLSQLLIMEDHEVVFRLQFEKHGLDEILKKLTKFVKSFPAFIEVLAKVCACQYYQNNVIVSLQQLLQSDFPTSLSNYMANTPFQRDVSVNWSKFFECLIVIFKKLFALLPHNASQILGPALLMSMNATTVLSTQFKADATYIADLNDINTQRMEILSKFDQPTQQQVSEEEMIQSKPPPDDFRQMSVVLCEADVHGAVDTFLRPNITRGSYNNVDHYLDVQFRLLRKDFVAPLRDGIIDYLTLMARDKKGQGIKLKDLKIYSKVQLVMVDKSPHGGITYKLSFDVSKLKHVKWDMTKRFLFGSLVCLSSDNFLNFCQATIANRDPKELANGIVSVKFLQEKPWEIDFTKTFVMVESPTYYEAYEPILKGLIEMTEDTLPFINTIVKAEPMINHPSYLNVVSSVYSLASLTGHECSCRPLLHETWPTNEELNLDESQHKALEAALTREIAVIQGPPGTGKTFLGLKIVEVLLKNKPIWSNGQRLPILIICFTNHALDQFLEGILKFLPDGIVRVGGQSKSEVLKTFNINNLKRNLSSARKVPDVVHKSRHMAMLKSKSIAEDIDKLQSSLRRGMDTILSESELLAQHVLSPKHFDQLCRSVTRMGGRKMESMATRIWLGLEGCSLKDLVKLDEEDTNQQLRRLVGFPENEDTASEGQASDLEDVLAEEEMANRLDDEEDWMEDDPWLPGAAAKHQTDNFATEVEYNSFENDDEVWEISKAERKRLAQKMKVELKKVDHMSEAEAGAVVDVFALDINDRWKLYRYWMAKLREIKLQEVATLQIEYEFNCQRLKEITQLFDTEILKNSEVIGMTTTGAAKHRTTLQQVHPAIVIVEEAAEVLETHIVTALSQNCKHLVLIGDQQQLRPSPTVYKLAKDYKMDVSLFERLINNGLPYEKLLLQHRMRPQIASLLVPHIYKDLKNHKSVEEYENIGGMVKNVFFLDHRNDEAAVTDTKSKSNEFEAEMIVALCRYLLLQGYEPSRITILATYLGQIFLIKRMVKGTIAKDVRCTVVDNYQGEENDIILLSLVRSNTEGIVGFLKVENRVCVALSRAKMALYVVGNFELLVSKAPVWAPIAKTLLTYELIGPAFQLVCQNHPNNVTDVKCSKDFDRVPEGGCLLPCEYRLSCGHKCEKVCHIIDKEHVTTKCLKLCNKELCELGHKCKKKCFAPCGNCLTLVEKMSPHCGHLNMIPCSIEPAVFACRKPCDRKLDCGHGCQLPCNEVCSSAVCNVMVKVKAPCGHMVTIVCYKSKNQVMLLKTCQAPCNSILSCEHTCKGSCYRCKQKRIHIECQEKCGRTLVCGHSCNVPCAENCPPCKRKCENRCFHSKCPKICGDPCKPCMEQCAWRCRHQLCNKLCHEACDREPCPEPCPMELPCGHMCIGHCGEPCPTKCRICDRDEVCEIFFGTEEEDGAKFVLLEDCGHVIESSAMDGWMTLPSNEGAEINLKACPKCKTVIRKNLRYGNTVKSMWNNIVLVKRKIMQEYNLLRQNTEMVKEKARRVLNEFKMFEFAHEQIRILISQEHLSIFEVNLLDNKVRFLLKMKNLWDCDRPSLMYERVKEKLLELEEILIGLKRQSAGEEVLKDFAQELRKVEFLRNVIVSVHHKHVSDQANECLQSLLNVLTDKVRFTPERETLVKSMIDRLNSLQTGLGISEAEKVEILRAMTDVGRGHWFKCRNGHIYAIGECGGAMETGTCPECRATVGGGHHQLLADNTLATEMDGATAPAYPTFRR